MPTTAQLARLAQSWRATADREGDPSNRGLPNDLARAEGHADGLADAANELESLIGTSAVGAHTKRRAKAPRDRDLPAQQAISTALAALGDDDYSAPGELAPDAAAITVLRSLLEQGYDITPNQAHRADGKRRIATLYLPVDMHVFVDLQAALGKHFPDATLDSSHNSQQSHLLIPADA